MAPKGDICCCLFGLYCGWTKSCTTYETLDCKFQQTVWFNHGFLGGAKWISQPGLTDHVFFSSSPRLLGGAAPKLFVHGLPGRPGRNQRQRGQEEAHGHGLEEDLPRHLPSGPRKRPLGPENPPVLAQRFSFFRLSIKPPPPKKKGGFWPSCQPAKKIGRPSKRHTHAAKQKMPAKWMDNIRFAFYGAGSCPSIVNPSSSHKHKHTCNVYSYVNTVLCT